MLCFMKRIHHLKDLVVRLLGFISFLPAEKSVKYRDTLTLRVHHQNMENGQPSKLMVYLLMITLSLSPYLLA